MWSSFVAIFRKEFLHIPRDRGDARCSRFTLPIIQLVLFGFIDQTVRDLPTVVVDQDQSRDEPRAHGRAARDQHLRRSRASRTNPHEARERDHRRARARVGVVIPPDFHDKRARGAGAKMLVLIDGSDSTVSAQALAAVNGLVAQRQPRRGRRSARRARAARSSAQPIILFNPEGRTANYIIPGLVAILLQIVAHGARRRSRSCASASTARSSSCWSRRSIRSGSMLGKLAPYLVIGLVEMALILAGHALRLRRADPRQPRASSSRMALIYLFALLALGLFISTRAQTQVEAQQMAQMLLPAVDLPVAATSSRSRACRCRSTAIGRVLPATHMIDDHARRRAARRRARSSSCRTCSRSSPSASCSSGRASAASERSRCDRADPHRALARQRRRVHVLRAPPRRGGHRGPLVRDRDARHRVAQRARRRGAHRRARRVRRALRDHRGSLPAPAARRVGGPRLRSRRRRDEAVRARVARGEAHRGPRYSHDGLPRAAYAARRVRARRRAHRAARRRVAHAAERRRRSRARDPRRPPHLRARGLRARVRRGRGVDREARLAAPARRERDPPRARRGADRTRLARVRALDRVGAREPRSPHGRARLRSARRRRPRSLPRDVRKCRHEGDGAGRVRAMEVLFSEAARLGLVPRAPAIELAP